MQQVSEELFSWHVTEIFLLTPKPVHSEEIVAHLFKALPTVVLQDLTAGEFSRYKESQYN